jgi:hypothetical protein
MSIYYFKQDDFSILTDAFASLASVFIRPCFKDSLKSGTRSIRGSGVRRLVKANGNMPNNWSTFLRRDENKTELFPFIIKVLVESIETRTRHVDYSWGL